MGVMNNIVFDDRVSEKLQALGRESPQMLENVLYMVSFAAKREVLRSMRQVLEERTGRLRKSIQYKRLRKGIFRLRAPNLASVYEYHGAVIEPTEAEALRFEAADGSEVFTRSAVHIEPRPFFYPGIRGFMASGKINEVASQEIDKKMKEAGLEI